jgi:hypothetical protein
MCNVQQPTVVSPWFSSAGWERTKRGIPSRRFQLKSNHILIVCRLTIAKRTHLPARSDGIDSDRIDNNRRQRSMVNGRASFQNFEIRHTWKEECDGEELTMWYNGERLVVVETMQGVQYLEMCEEFNLEQGWRSTHDVGQLPVKY